MSHLAYLKWLREADSEDDNTGTPPKSVATPPWKSKASAAAQISQAHGLQPGAGEKKWWDELSDSDDEMVSEMAEIRAFVSERRQNKEKQNKENHSESTPDGSTAKTTTKQDPKASSPAAKAPFGASQTNQVALQLAGLECSADEASEFRKNRALHTLPVAWGEYDKKEANPAEEVPNPTPATLQACTKTADDVRLPPTPAAQKSRPVETEEKSDSDSDISARGGGGFRLRWCEQVEERLEVEKIAWDEVIIDWEDPGRSYFYESNKDRRCLAKQRKQGFVGRAEGRSAALLAAAEASPAAGRDADSDDASAALPPLVVEDGPLVLRGILKPFQLLSPREEKRANKQAVLAVSDEQREREKGQAAKNQLLASLLQGRKGGFLQPGEKPVLLVLDAKCLTDPDSVQLCREMARQFPKGGEILSLLVPHQVRLQVEREPTLCPYMVITAL